MNCDQAKKYHIFYIEGDLDQKLRAGFEAHLSACDDCSCIYDQMKTAVDLISSEKHRISNPYFFNRIEQKLANANERSRNHAPAFVRILKPVLLVVLIMISATIGLIIGGTGQKDESNFTNSGTSVTEIAGQYQLNMSQEEILENYYTTH